MMAASRKRRCVVLMLRAPFRWAMCRVAMCRVDVLMELSFN
jgi:hypothetical protein